MNPNNLQIDPIISELKPKKAPPHPSLTAIPMWEISTMDPTTSFPLSPPKSSLDEGDSVPEPLECLQGNPVPPFLSKTFDLVDDPSLDQIISWGSAGASFVVWDPLEFSRHVLPRNFKHNNFSSFVRQLNTYHIPTKLPLLIGGFRKINVDKWEFFNEYFQRGKKQLLKNIQRRRAPSQSQQLGIYIGPSGDVAKPELEVEIQKLRRERSALMQEVVELQQQQRRTVQHAREVNQRLHSAELRQKQMVSCLVRFFQNPTLLADNKHEKEQIVIESPRVRRKFFKHHQHQTGTSDSLEGGQIVRYQPDWRKSIPVEQSPLYLSQGLARELNGVAKKPTSQFETAVSHELGTMNEASPATNIIGDGSSNFGHEDPLFKGKTVMSLNQDVPDEYLVSFPDDLIKETGFPEFPSLGTEILDIWKTNFNVSGSGSSSVNDPWGDHEVPGFGVTSGISDMWEMNSLKVNGNLPSDEYCLGQPKQ